MGTFDRYATSSELETLGTDLDLGSVGIFKIARAGGANRKYEDLVRDLTRPHQSAIQSGNMEPSVADRILVEAFSKTVVLGWYKKGDTTRLGYECEYDVTGPDGEPLPYSIQNAKMLLEKLPDLMADIKKCSESAAAYSANLLEQEGKSSAPVSDTA